MLSGLETINVSHLVQVLAVADVSGRYYQEKVALPADGWEGEERKACSRQAQLIYPDKFPNLPWSGPSLEAPCWRLAFGYLLPNSLMRWQVLHCITFLLFPYKNCETQWKIEFCNEHPSTYHLDFVTNTLFFVLYHMSAHSSTRLYLIFFIHFIGSCRL